MEEAFCNFLYIIQKEISCARFAVTTPSLFTRNDKRKVLV